MKPTSWREVLETIRQTDPDKAAGYDGITSGLLNFLTEHITEHPSYFLNILT